MTFVVPFDGSELAEAALIRAAEFETVFDERVVALSVVPADNAAYARERDWLARGETFDLETVVGTLHERVTALVPAADFEHVVVDTHATGGTIARTIRDRARDADASVVFLGSENAGKVVSRVGEVGPSVAAEESYDVHIVRHRAPSKIARLADSPGPDDPKSEFYLPRKP